ncbi:MAG: putative membrane protein [Rhodobacteraceae bacterium HLUCCA12]|nr:MAG: putative membrane protein [Rhodobacteraceae bacterium HLUCCA12]
MNYSTLEIWVIILGLGLGTVTLRFSFLGLIGSRQLPEWVLRHLRYTPVAVLPGLVAPQVFFPAATGGTTDPLRLIAAGVTLAVGYYSKSVVWAIVAGFATLTGLMALTGSA